MRRKEAAPQRRPDPGESFPPGILVWVLKTTERLWLKPDLDERRFYHGFRETVKTSVSFPEIAC